MKAKHPALHRIVSFAISGPHALDLVFEDGHARRVDFSPFLHGELYGPLRDPREFARVSLDALAGTVQWPSGADFDPSLLYEWPVHEADFIRAAQVWAESEPAMAKEKPGHYSA